MIPSSSEPSNRLSQFYLLPDDERECWKLMKRTDVGDGDEWHIADFYDGDMRETLLGNAVCNWLNVNML